MFVAANPNLSPQTRKDSAPAEQRRAFVRRRPNRNRSPDEESWMQAMGRSTWRRELLGGAPFSPGQAKELSDAPLPQHMSSSSTSPGYRSHHVNDTGRRAAHADDRMPFDKATEALVGASNEAIKVCSRLVEKFDDETKQVRLWVEPSVVDALWRMRLEWDGMLASPPPEEGKSRQTPEYTTFQGVVREYCDALRNLRYSHPPDMGRFATAESQLSPQVLRTTQKKLRVTLQGIEELLDDVVGQRSLMPPLVKELKAAHGLLLDIDYLWRPLKNPGGDRRPERSAWL